MDFKKLQDKTLRRVASPVELVYAVWSHWFIIFFFMLCGTIAVLIRVSGEPPVYSARATLILKPPQTITKKDIPGSGRSDIASFINEQAKILQSESVLKDVVVSLQYHRGQVSDDDREEETRNEKAKWYEAIFEKVRETTESLFEGDDDENDDELNESARIDKLVNKFRDRIDVNPSRGSNQVRLRVLGRSKKAIERETAAWIAAYKGVLKRLSRETVTPYLEDRYDRWKELAAEAKHKIETYSSEHPDANRFMQEFHKDNISQRQMDLVKLEIMLESARSNNTLPTPTVVEDSVIAIYEEKKKKLQLRRVELEARFPETSTKVQELDEELAAVDRQIARLRSGASQSNGGPMLTDVESLATEIQRRSTEIEEDRRLLAQIENQIDVLDELKRDYSFKVAQRDEYERRAHWDDDVNAGRHIMVQVLDEPGADVGAIDAKKDLQVSVGAVGGALIGILLGFLAELFCRRVRFKKDVVEELGLEVVGVLPTK